MIVRQKFCYLVVLNEKFLTQLASGLTPQNDKVFLRVGISRALDLRPKDKQSALPQVITPKLLHLAVNRLHLNQIFLVLKTRLTLYLHQIAGLNIQ